MENKEKRLTIALTIAAMSISAGAFTAFADEGDVEISKANFPDAAFMEYVKKFDTTPDGKLSQDEIAAVKEISVSGKKITDLSGIEFFTAVTELDCRGNQLTALDLSKNTALTSLICNNNKLTSLDLSNNKALTGLFCSSNKLTELNISGCDAIEDINCNRNKLTELDVKNKASLLNLECSYNQLGTLDLSGTALERLECSGNSLAELDLSNCGKLTSLICSQNNLTELDVSHNKALRSLNCYNNQLADLDVSGCTKLETLSCGDSKLESLNVSGCTGLKTLDCAGNQLKSLDVRDISGLTALCCGINQLSSLDVNRNTALTDLRCSKNKLSSLDVSSNTALTQLWCEDNKITSLDVSGHNALEDMVCYDNQLESLNVSGCGALEKLDISKNQLTSLDLSGCTSITWFACDNQKFYIDKVNISYPLSSLPAGFDYKKAGGWTGAEYDADTNSLKNFTSTAVTYVYDCGNGKAMNVTLSLGSYLSQGDAEINEENFPDSVFRQYVYVNFDTDHDYIMTKNELAAVSEIDVSDKGISDLKGIEYFTALTYLDCGNNKLESLDVSRCTALTQLWCGDNKLKALNVSGSTGLEILSCGGNQLTELDLGSNTALGSLSCNNNKLTVLDVSNNADLSSLNCDDNQLVSLNVSRNTALLSLSCANNGLTALNASGNTLLKDLNCANNRLASLDVSGNTALTGLTCSDNQITELDAGRCSALRMLECRNNKLTRLDVSGCSSLALLQCSGNRLTSLDLSRCTSLANANLTGNSFDIGEVTSSYDLKNLPADFDITKASDWQGATPDGSVLTNFTSDRITYTYDCGNGISADFTLTVALVPEEPVSAFVERLYTTLLDRPSDEKGKAEWAADLKNGRSAADAASGFVLSEELKNQNLSNGEFVDRMYRTFLDREADAAGKADWVSILDSGCSYAYILNSFAGSQEFINLCDSYGITAGSYESSEPRDKNPNLTAFVSRMYTKALGRAYDVNGLNDWTGDYLDGKATADRIAYGFILSDEFAAKERSDSEYVDILYSTFFDREPDEGGKAGWLDELNNGASRKDVLDGFLGAEEFANLKAGFGV